MIDLLAAIPSVVFGLWGVLVLAPDARRRSTSGSPTRSATCPVLGAFFGGPVNGRSFMTAGLILAIMIIPIITSITREVFATVPALAARGGARRWAPPAGR